MPALDLVGGGHQFSPDQRFCLLMDMRKPKTMPIFAGRWTKDPLSF
jgi:hypothetical protein